MENYEMLKKKLAKITLREDTSLKAISESLCVDEIEIYGMINRLKKDGYNIQVIGQGEEALIKNYGHTQIENSLGYEIVDNSDTKKIMLISDTRLGSIYQQLSMLNHLYEFANEIGVKEVYHCGDVSEGVYRNLEHNQTLLFCEDYYEQLKYIVDNYPYVNGMNTYFITGEHDRSHYAKTKLDIGRKISEKREDMIYLGQNSVDISFTNEENLNKIVLRLMHLKKAGSTYTLSYKLQKYISALRSDEKVDIIAQGHQLTMAEVFDRNVYGFQVPGLCATTPEMLEKEFNPSTGAWIVTINKSNNGKKKDFGKLESISRMAVPFYTTQKDDYKRTKALKIGRAK